MGCFAGRGCTVGSLCSWRLGNEGLVPHSVGGLSAFFVHTRMDEAQLSNHKLGNGAGHCFPDCGGDGTRVWDGTAMVSLCLEGVGRQSSLFQ